MRIKKFKDEIKKGSNENKNSIKNEDKKKSKNWE